MFKNICKLTLLIIVFISSVLIVQHLKKKSIIKEINSQTDTKYNISDNIRRFVNNGHTSSDPEKIPSYYKLVYEMDLGCSSCLIDMKEVHNFYIKLSGIHEIEFCLITKIKSYSYIKYYLDQSLENYDLWVVHQKVTNNNIKLYLIDGFNNIVMAGDITKYPFLKDEYIKKLKIIRFINTKILRSYDAKKEKGIL